MGIRFGQARETIHIAVELIDSYYLARCQALDETVFKREYMDPKVVILHQVTALLIASKYDEIDDNITAIKDLRHYITSQLHLQNKRREIASYVPTFDDVVECERAMLHHFDWQFNFLLPLHFVRLFMANGIIYRGEFRRHELRLSEGQLTEIL